MAKAWAKRRLLDPLDAPVRWGEAWVTGREIEEFEAEHGYRMLKKGELHVRRKCIECGEKNLAMYDSSIGACECRHCGAHFVVNTLPRRR